MTSEPASRFRLRVSDEPPPTADLVVVGAGVVGCATAFRATRAGLRTVVLDARPRPATLTTAAATGAYRLQFDNAEEVALVREGVEL
jgi:sarcosine oxidase subunit beta